MRIWMWSSKFAVFPPFPSRSPDETTSILQEVVCDLKDENGHHWRDGGRVADSFAALSERVTLSSPERCLASCAILPTGIPRPPCDLPLTWPHTKSR